MMKNGLFTFMVTSATMLLGSNLTMAQGLHGRYDGSYDPASSTPPDGKSKCLAVTGTGCSIKPNSPSQGRLLIDDSKSSKDAFVSLKIPQDIEKDFQGRPMDIEYEYSARFAAQSAGVATSPIAECGFFDEGGKGCRVTMAWYKTAADEYLVALNGINEYPLTPLSSFKWEDGKPHTYTLKKYRDSKSGKMVIQVLIDGEPQLKTPVLYGGNMTLVEPWRYSSVNNSKGFQFRTGGLAIGSFVLDYMEYGPLQNIPPLPAQDGIVSSTTKNEWTKAISGLWRIIKNENSGKSQIQVKGSSVILSVNGSAMATSGELALKPNRSYTIKGSYSTSGEISSIKLRFDQFTQRYPQNGLPFYLKPLPVSSQGQTVTFEFPVYQRIIKELADVTILAEGNGTVTLNDLSITEGGRYPNYMAVELDKPRFNESDIEKKLASYSSPQQIKVDKGNGFYSLSSPEGKFAAMYYNGRLGTKLNGSWWGTMGQAGIHLQSVSVGLPSGDIKPIWLGKDKYDYSGVEQAIKLVLSRDLSAKILLHFFADPYEGWCLENPTEICRNSKGQYAWGVQHFGYWGGISEKKNGCRLLPSIMSSKAKEDIVEMLCSLDKWLNTNPAGRSVVGYYIMGFNDADFGHWVHPGTAAGQKEPDDYSPGAAKSWRNWLNGKYGNDIAKLNSTWGTSIADFESIAIPSPERRRLKGGDFFPWIPEKQNTDVVDFNRFYGEACGDFVSGIVNNVKERTGGGRIFLTHVGNPMHGWRGYTGYGKLLKSKALDLIVATADYGCRRPGYAGGANLIPESIGLQGKIAIHEIDHRTHTDPSHYEGMDFNCGRSEDGKEFQSIVFRDGMNMIVRGHSLYYFDMSGENYGDPEVMTTVKNLKNIAEQQLTLSGPPIAEVAYFLGEDSINFLGDNPESSRFLMRNTRRQREQWDTAGVPYHLYLQRDIADAQLPKYKVYVFLLPQKIDEKELQAIQKLKRDGNTLVFLHAPGICETSDMEKTILEITGIRAVRIPGVDTALAGIWLSGKNPLLKGLEGNFGDRPLYGMLCERESKGLAFAIDDPTTTALAKYRDNNKVAVAVRDFGTWRSIYLAVPWLDAQFINNIAKTANAWSVAEPHDAVFANQHFIGAHAMSAGKKTFRPLKTSKVTDAITGELIAEKANEFTVEIPFGQTRIFRTEACQIR